jgi:hypothetical protein
VWVSRSRGCAQPAGYRFRLVRREGLWPVIDQDAGTVYPGQTIYIPLVGRCSSGTHVYMAYISYPVYDPGTPRRLTC